MNKKDFLDIIKDLPDNSCIKIKDSRCFILSNFTYPKQWKISTNNNDIVIEIIK